MPNVSAFLAEVESGLRSIYPAITFGLGEKDLARQDLAPPRIIWIPTVVKHGGPSKQATNPRRLLTRSTTIIAHCWAAETTTNTPIAHYDACEALVHDLLVQLHKSTRGSIVYGGEEWTQPTNTDFGYAALVTFTPDVPVLSQVYATAPKPLGLLPDTVSSVAGDTKIDWGEP